LHNLTDGDIDNR